MLFGKDVTLYVDHSDLSIRSVPVPPSEEDSCTWLTDDLIWGEGARTTLVLPSAYSLLRTTGSMLLCRD